MSAISQMFRDLVEEKRRQWSHPPSWWNLFVLWPLPFVLAFCIYSQRTDLQIAKRQLTAVATINSHDPSNHDRYGYTFAVDGRQFTGWAYPNDKRDFSIEERIVIYFDPIDPARNSTDDFHKVSNRDLFFVSFCLLAIVVLPLVIFFQRRSRLKASKKPLPSQ